MESTTLVLVFVAEWKWWDIVSRREEITLTGDDADCSWDEACALAGADPEDEEVGIGVVDEVAEDHSLIKAGDFVVSSGYGADVYFLRATSQD